MTYPCKTNNYLHLGGLLHHGQDQCKELKCRLALAHAAFNQHRRVLYHNDRVSPEKRSDLFQVLLVSKLLYASESWLITDNRTVSTFSAAIFKLYKRLLGVRPDEHIHHEAILAHIGLPFYADRGFAIWAESCTVEPPQSEAYCPQTRTGVAMLKATSYGCGNNYNVVQISPLQTETLASGDIFFFIIPAIGSD